MQEVRDCKNPSCDNTFTPKVHNQRYCVDQCKREVENLRRKASFVDDNSFGGLNDVLEGVGAYSAPALRERQATQPTLWRPGVVWSDNDGEITSRPVEHPTPHWGDILSSWGYDPAEYEIVEPVKVSTWDAPNGEGGTKQLWSYKAGIRVKHNEDAINYEDLLDEIRKEAAHKPVGDRGTDTFVVPIGDTQFGKGDGDGLKGTIARFLEGIDKVEYRIKELRSLGRNLGHLVVALMGDIMEACDGNYPAQTFTVEANRREQNRIARRLIRDAIMRWSKHFDKVTVLAVPGNHGENRKNGKAFTTVGDNDDVAVVEIIAEVFAANPEAFGHVEFLIPEDDIAVTIDIGKVVGFTHGHFARSGTSAQAKIKNWWADQAFGLQPVGEASILVTAHYHHFSVIEHGPRTHIQIPALDGGSEWFVNAKGEQSRPGIACFVVNSNGYQDLEVL